MTSSGLLYVIAAFLPLLASVLLFSLRRRGRSWAGWVVTASLAAAAVLSIIGLLLFQQHVQQAKQQLQVMQPWSGSFVWMQLSHLLYENTGKLGFAPDTPGISLRLGYQVDALTTYLFTLITLVALGIHLVALRSMRKELKAELFEVTAQCHRPGRYVQFFQLMGFFTSVMLHLVLADNLVQLFVCWELVGLASYFLIGFYREQPTALTASRKAFLMNRAGDVGFLLGIFILFTATGTISLVTVREDLRDVLGNIVMEDGVVKKRITQLSLSDALRTPAVDSHDEPFAEKGAEAGMMSRVNHTRSSSGKRKLELNEAGSDVVIWNMETLNGHYDKPDKRRYDAFNPKKIGEHGQGLRTIPYWLLGAAGIGLFLGCIGKSAQLPLQTWLPDAMAGPTPVSALVHSATMVAAGVYLIARLFPILIPEVLLVVAYVGVITACYGAICALGQTDLKRLLAYSTMSQLGFMMASVGVGGWAMALYHLATHACCKAVLFLGSGAVADSCNGVQDLRRLGSLRKAMPALSLIMLIACLSLAGLPLLPGWYSKDGILESLLSFSSLSSQHVLLIALPILTTALTGAYLLRFWWNIFMGQARDVEATSTASDVTGIIRWSMLGLLILGFVLVWLPHPISMNSNWSMKLLQQSEPAAVREETSIPLAGAAEQIASGYFKSESWLRPLTDALHIGPHTVTMTLALVMTLLGIGYGWLRMNHFNTSTTVTFLTTGWDQLYRQCLIAPLLKLGHWLQAVDHWFWDGLIHLTARFARGVAYAERQFDERLIDGLVNQSARLTQGSGFLLRQLQTGSLRFYLILMLCTLVAIGSVAIGFYWLIER
jgi:NADH-quinone oxidoreductase subunit L